MVVDTSNNLWFSISSFVTIVSFINIAFCQANDNCIGMIDEENGFNKHVTDCSKYYRCFKTVQAGGLLMMMKSTIQQCSFGTFWSPDISTCVEWDDMTCPNGANICYQQADNTKFAYLGCNTYWQCMGGKPLAKKCQTDHIFNSNTLMCVSSPGHVCLTPNTQPACNFLVDPNDPAKYFVKISNQDGTMSQISLSCPKGTLYDNANCNCGTMVANVVPQNNVCKPLVENGLGNKFTGTDNSDVVVGSTGLNFQSGVNKIVFTSGSSLNIWRLANYDYSAFAATLTIEFPAFTGSPVTEQILNNYIALPTSSGIVNDETSISLVVLKSTSAFTFRGKVVTTTGLVNVNVNTGSAVTGPVNIIFVYDGAKVVLRVGSSEASESLTGKIKLSQTGMVLGRGKTMTEHQLHASISNLKIYDCITQTMRDTLSAI